MKIFHGRYRPQKSRVRVMVFNTTFNNISVIIVAVCYIGGGKQEYPVEAMQKPLHESFWGKKSDLLQVR